MNRVELDDSENVVEEFSSLSWNYLGTEMRSGDVITRLSCVLKDFPGLLILQRLEMRISATSSLVRLRMQHARLSGVSTAIQLNDVGTSLGVFARRVWELMPGHQRTVIVAAAEIDGGPDAIVQFVIPGVDHDLDDLEALSLLSISKVLEMHELDKAT